MIGHAHSLWSYVQPTLDTATTLRSGGGVDTRHYSNKVMLEYDICCVIRISFLYTSTT